MKSFMSPIIECMPPKRLVATTLHRAFNSGRTVPLLMQCEGENGQEYGEYVVKLKSRMDRDSFGLAAEFLGACLAQQFGLKTPEIAVVEITEDFVKSVKSAEERKYLERAGSLTFGSKLEEEGVSTWSQGFILEAELIQYGWLVFFFDAISENPDRRYDKPNLLYREGELLLIDHELAFSFLELIGTHDWSRHGFSFLENHVFFRQLRSQGSGRCDRALVRRGVANLDIGPIIQSMPPAWQEESKLSKVVAHIAHWRENVDTLIETVFEVFK